MKKVIYICILTLSSIAELSGMQGEPVLKKSKIDQELTLNAQELIVLADIYKKQGLWQQAVESYEAALPISKSLKELYAVNTALGSLYGIENPNPSKGAYRKASFFFENVLTVLGHFKAENANQHAELTTNRHALLCRLTDICFQADRSTEAITYGKQALDLSKDYILSADICRTIGTYYRSTDLAASEAYLRRGLDKMETGKTESIYLSKKTQTRGLVCKELAHTLFVGSSAKGQCNLEKLSEAKSLYNEALKCEENLKQRAGIWIQLGLICKKTRTAQEARAYFELASQESVRYLNPQAYACAKIMLEKIGG